MPHSAAVGPSLMRTMNCRLLFHHLFDFGPATRPQLARDAGLSLPTVIAALADLEEAKLVRPIGRPETGQGRPAIVFEADPRAGHVVGVDVGRSWLHVRVADLAGTSLHRFDTHNTARTSSALVSLVSDAVATATTDAGLEPGDVTHTVIGSPGVYDPGRGRVLYAANLPGWQRVGLAETLAHRMGGSLTVDNDANLAAIGEHTYGRGRGTRHFVYAHIGTGVGLGLVLDGALYRGFAGAAGEAAYLPIDRQIAGAGAGRPQRGILEASLAADAVVRYAQEAGMAGPLTAEKVFSAARRGDPHARQAIDREAEQLAHLLVSITAMFDPELIVVGGGVGQNLELLEPSTRAALARISPLKPRFTGGELGSEAVVQGAIATAIQRARELVFATITDAGRPGLRADAAGELPNRNGTGP